MKIKAILFKIADFAAMENERENGALPIFDAFPKHWTKQV